MAEARAVVDVVGADHDPHQLLHQVVLLVGRAGRGDRRDRVRARASSRIRRSSRGDVGRAPRPSSPARSSPSRRISGVVSRSGERTKPCAKRPLTQAWPRLTGASRFGRDRRDLAVARRARRACSRRRSSRRWSWSCARSAARSSRARLRRARRSGRSRRSRRRRRSRTRSTAPPVPGATTVSEPRPTSVSAKVPCTSSHIRTQRPQAMQRSRSSLTYGCESSRPRRRARRRSALRSTPSRSADADELAALGRQLERPRRAARTRSARARRGRPRRRPGRRCATASPSAAGVVQAGTGARRPTATRQARQAPDGARRGRRSRGSGRRRRRRARRRARVAPSGDLDRAAVDGRRSSAAPRARRRRRAQAAAPGRHARPKAQRLAVPIVVEQRVRARRVSVVRPAASRGAARARGGCRSGTASRCRSSRRRRSCQTWRSRSRRRDALVERDQAAVAERRAARRERARTRAARRAASGAEEAAERAAHLERAQLVPVAQPAAELLDRCRAAASPSSTS